MSDGQIAFYWILGLFIVFLIGCMIGFEVEKNRIYEKCVERNSTMVHAEVTKMCKEFTK